MSEDRKAKARRWRECFTSRIQRAKMILEVVDAYERGERIMWRASTPHVWEVDNDFDPIMYDDVEYKPAPTVSTIPMAGGDAIPLTPDIEKVLTAAGFSINRTASRPARRRSK